MQSTQKQQKNAESLRRGGTATGLPAKLPYTVETTKKKDTRFNNCKNDFDYFLNNYEKHAADKGDIYTWGSGEMGQLGYGKKFIQKMPKDREGYPF